MIVTLSLTSTSVVSCCFIFGCVSAVVLLSFAVDLAAVSSSSLSLKWFIKSTSSNCTKGGSVEDIFILYIFQGYVILLKIIIFFCVFIAEKQLHYYIIMYKQILQRFLVNYIDFISYSFDCVLCLFASAQMTAEVL